MEKYRDKTEDDYAVVLFDGVCNLCNAAVRFIIPRDPKRYFRFAPLQSETALQLLDFKTYAVDPAATDSVMLIENGKLFTESSAALRISRKLNRGWPLLYALIVIPRPIRDAMYRFIAKNRYRWFGKSSECMLPTPEQRSRFLG